MTDMRDDFEAAMQSLDTDIEELPSEILHDEPTMEAEAEAGTPAPESEAAPQADGEPAAADTPAEPAEAAAPAEPAESPAINPPIGYSPEARELWKDVPVKVQEQIHKREQEIAMAMQNTAAARKTYDNLNSLAQSYAPIMAAEGAQDVMQAVQGLFETVAELRMGSPQQKAQKMAQLISHYGIDIAGLDSALAGSPQGPEVSQNSQFEHLIDQKMAPINQMMEQLNALQMQKQQTTQQNAVQEIQQFGQQAEFLNDVRNDMADLIDMAAARGYDMSLQEAYNKACALNPQIQAVIDQRKQAEALQATQQSNAAKMAASSSVIGRKAGDGVAAPTSLHDQLSAAWDELAQG
jgi:hypothetical protein